MVFELIIVLMFISIIIFWCIFTHISFSSDNCNFEVKSSMVLSALSAVLCFLFLIFSPPIANVNDVIHDYENGKVKREIIYKKYNNGEIIPIDTLYYYNHNR